MNCKITTENISAYLDKVLSDSEMEQFDAHFQECSACRQELAEMQKTIELLASLDEVIPPASFRRELRSKLEKSVSKDRFSLINFWQRVARKRYTTFAPIAVAMILLIIIVPFAIENSQTKLFKSDFSRSTADSVDGVAGMAVPPEYMTNQSVMDAKESEMMPDSMKRDIARVGNEGPADADYNIEGAETPTIMKTYSQEELNEEIIPQERKIIKNADLRLRVDSLEQTVAEIKNQLSTMGGYLASESTSARDTQGTIRGYLQIRLPYQQFDSFLDSLGTMGKLQNSNIYTQDVTEEFVDVASRLKVMRQKEERLLAILDKAGQLADVLAVENELAHTRAELESLEGRLRYLNNRVDYSTININLEQVTVPTQAISAGGLEGVFGRAAEAFITTINNLLVGLGKLVVFIFAALPVFIIIVIICYIAWRLSKKRIKKDK